MDGEQQRLELCACGDLVQTCGFLRGLLRLFKLLTVNNAEDPVPLIEKGLNLGR